VLAQHREGGGLVDAVTLHQDALGALGQRPAPERRFEVVVLGEAAKDDVDRALPVLGVGVADVGEDAALRRLPDELGIARVQKHDHRAGRLAHDLVDQLQRVLGALPETDERDVGPLACGDGTDVGDLDLARDHLVPEGHDDRSDEGEAVLALVRDQDAQMLGVALAHGRSGRTVIGPRAEPDGLRRPT
jgi:hypothetical protein